MSRTSFTFSFSRDIENAIRNVENVLAQNGYKKINQNNEEIWKKGTGLMSGVKFIKTEFSQNSLTLYGWVKTGLGGPEMDLSGFALAVPKKSVMKVIEQIKMSV